MIDKTKFRLSPTSVLTYVFDTSAFIAWWHELYPVGTFGDVFELITQDVANGKIRSPIEVKQELQKKEDDELTIWVKDQPRLFIPIRHDLQDKIATVTSEYSKLRKQMGKTNADPVVIALAQAENGIVVTQESPKKQNNMVTCCRDMGIKCMSLSQYIVAHPSELNAIRKELWRNL